MPPPDIETDGAIDGMTEGMLVRTTVVSVALQALVKRLVLNGTLSQADLLAMREMGLQVVADLRLLGGAGAQIAGDWMEREVAAWWDMLETIERPPTN